MAIGEIVTQDQLQSLQRENEKLFSQRAYVAPTVFRLANAQAPRWNYYATKADALNKYLFLAQLHLPALPLKQWASM